MKYLISLLILVSIVSAQIQPYEPKVFPTPFSITTQTTWDRDHWNDGISAPVTVGSTTQATMCLNAPTCYGACSAPDCREGKLYLLGQALPRAILQCPMNGQCCVTYQWTAQGEESYYIKATNETDRLDCGPTQVRVRSGIFNCQFN